MREATAVEKRSLVKELFGCDAEEKLHPCSAYFRAYDSFTGHQHASIQIYPPAISSHDDIRRLALELRANPQSTRKEFRDMVFPPSVTEPLTADDHEKAIDLAIQVVLMIDCADKDRHWEVFEIGGFRPVRWEESKSFSDFIGELFSTAVQDHATVQTALREEIGLKC